MSDLKALYEATIRQDEQDELTLDDLLSVLYEIDARFLFALRNAYADGTLVEYTPVVGKRIEGESVISDLTREQVEAVVSGDGMCGLCLAALVDSDCDERSLADQLLATMDALTTAEARIEAALALSDVGAESEKRGERVGPKFAECIAAILRDDYDTPQKEDGL
jgi:hypothetical protein